MLRSLKEKHGDPWYEPDPLLVNMVEEGRLGLRTKKASTSTSLDNIASHNN
jgi:3-hydroxyacyl-CoA dehydrogenase